eukprot:1354606-Prymnesium_polylepis.1
MAEAAERVRGPPCVAFQSKECQDDPSRQTQYTFVPLELPRQAWPRHQRVRVPIEALPPPRRAEG